MYVDDADQAFGSWCVRGAGTQQEQRVPSFAGRTGRKFSVQEEDVLMNYFYTQPLVWLYHSLWDNQDDPRRQRIIQHVYEWKIKKGREIERLAPYVK